MRGRYAAVGILNNELRTTSTALYCNSHTRLVTKSTRHRRAHNKATSLTSITCTPVR